MTRSEAGKLGGKIWAERSRQAALDRYYKDPNYCETCGKVIEVKETERVSHVRQKRFCNRSCATKHNNRVYPKRKPDVEQWPCDICGTTIKYSGPYRRKYCDKCVNPAKGVAVKRRMKKNGYAVLPKPLDEMSKGELKALKQHHYRYKGVLQADARQKYIDSGRPLVCKICGYSKAVDVCHKKSIASFTDETLVSIMNHINNLVALCKTHHWELDHELLDDDILL